MKTNDDVRQILDRLERALAQAISSCPDAAAAIRRIRHDGYALSLILNCQPQDLEREAERLAAARRHVPRYRGKPAFRLNGQDVVFLRSVGIDGTRPAGRRRRNV